MTTEGVNNDPYVSHDWTGSMEDRDPVQQLSSLLFKNLKFWIRHPTQLPTDGVWPFDATGGEGEPSLPRLVESKHHILSRDKLKELMSPPRHCVSAVAAGRLEQNCHLHPPS